MVVTLQLHGTEGEMTFENIGKISYYFDDEMQMSQYYFQVKNSDAFFQLPHHLVKNITINEDPK